MCVTFVYINNEVAGADPSAYQLIVINNRDEHFDRPTSVAAWEDTILCGRDEANPGERGGTWLGVSANGRVGVLLSILEKKEQQNPNAPTRGTIVNDYLKSELSAFEYANRLTSGAQQYNGFNVLLFDRELKENGRYEYSLVNYMNKKERPVEFLHSGTYGFGNCSHDEPFKKVTYGLKLFTEKVDQLRPIAEAEVIEQCLQILTDKTNHHPDTQLLSQTDQDERWSAVMSQLFYEFPAPYRYGTRSHTVLLMNGFGHCTYFERSRRYDTSDSKENSWIDTIHHFDLKP